MAEQLSQEHAWKLLLALAARATDASAMERCSVGLSGGDIVLGAAEPLLDIDPAAPRGWRPAAAHSPPAWLAQMLDLYVPLCVGERAASMVVAHLGQSLDGRIATRGGASQFITGEENLEHTHRMRALFDAVLVGANTASSDNPRLTTRRVEGEHPTRILIDPRCSVDPAAHIFTDEAARTLVLCDTNFMPEGADDSHIGLRTEGGMIAPAAIIEALSDRGLRRLFIEGGGLTVSKFLHAGALDRLQVCVAPMIIGSGRPAFELPEVEALSEGIFLDAKHFPSGRDLLFDCQLRGSE